MSVEQELEFIGRTYQATLSALVYDHLATTLEEALVLLGGEEAPEYEGITYVIEALYSAIGEIARNLLEQQ